MLRITQKDTPYTAIREEFEDGYVVGPIIKDVRCYDVVFTKPLRVHAMMRRQLDKSSRVVFPDLPTAAYPGGIEIAYYSYALVTTERRTKTGGTVEYLEVLRLYPAN